MTPFPLFDKAARFAAEAHAGQVDKNGRPYIFHPMAVASRFTEDTEMAAAVLHDVVEDTPVTLADVLAEFGPEVTDLVDALTRRIEEKETFRAYIERVARHSRAIPLKIADIEHNRGRLSGLSRGEAIGMEKRYERALAYLNAVREEREAEY